jgi:transposase
MRCSSPFTPLSRGSGASKDVVGNAWLSPLEIIGKSMVLAWSIGAMAGLMAGLLLDAPPMCSVNKCGQPLLVRARRGRVAIVIADNLKIHTSAGSLLVRSMLLELKEELSLIYTPAYDPDANRIEWLWRISRRVVTHNHQRRDFQRLVADVETHFQALALSPEDVLSHIGSPFAPEKATPLPETLAA